MNKSNFKKAFSLLEIIFAIVIIAVIASVAVPKLMSSKDNATASAIKQDLHAITTNIQSYYLVNGSVSKISDVISLNSSTWTIADKKVQFIEDGVECIAIEITTNNSIDTLTQTINSNSTTPVCKKLQDSGIQNDTFTLN
jgi:general secretion pathway protein G